MKNLFLILALFAFLGTSFTTVYASSDNTIPTENLEEKKCEKCGKEKCDCKAEGKAHKCSTTHKEGHKCSHTQAKKCAGSTATEGHKCSHAKKAPCSHAKKAPAAKETK